MQMREDICALARGQQQKQRHHDRRCMKLFARCTVEQFAKSLGCFGHTLVRDTGNSKRGIIDGGRHIDYRFSQATLAR
jgi:hypothetical protein